MVQKLLSLHQLISKSKLHARRNIRSFHLAVSAEKRTKRMNVIISQGKMFFAIMNCFKISTRVALTAATKVPTGAKHTLFQFNFDIMYFSRKRF